jgi:hypothetical protein
MMFSFYESIRRLLGEAADARLARAISLVIIPLLPIAIELVIRGWVSTETIFITFSISGLVYAATTSVKTISRISLIISVLGAVTYGALLGDAPEATAAAGHFKIYIGSALGLLLAVSFWEESSRNA